MAETNGSLLQQNDAMHSIHVTLDPKSLILSQFPDLDKPQLLQLTTESFILERGPRFKEYSDLRDEKLRMKRFMDPDKKPEEKIQSRSILTPPKKQVKFSSNFGTPPKRSKPPSVLTQSVPDFSSALRKENRRPAAALPPVAELTPPPKSGRVGGGGSKSANSTEKRCGAMMARKSYASMAELKSLGVETVNGINGGRSGRGAAKTTLFGYRQF